MIKCREKIRDGDQWPPDLSEFLALINGHSAVDFYAAFTRCMDRKPLGRAETWVFQNSGFNLRAVSQDSAERMHKKFLKEAIEKERRGDLVLHEDMPLGIAEHSVKNVNDIAREEYLEKNGQYTCPRLARMMALSKKNREASE